MRLRLGIAAAVAVLCGASAGLSANRDDLWGEVRLPGGVQAAWQVLGWNPAGRTPEAFLLDLSRFRHGLATSSFPPGVEDLSAYLTHLSQLEAALRSVPDGLQFTPTLSKDRARRDRTRDVLELLGIRLTSSRGRFQAQVQDDSNRQYLIAWAALVGIDAKAVADQLNAGEVVRLSVPGDVLPVPLPDVWSTLIDGGVEDLGRLVLDSKSLLLYMGLMASDRETLEWLRAHPRDVRRLRDDRAAAWAGFGRSVRIRGGIVSVPGGAAEAPLWEDLVGEAVAEPRKFLDRVLESDEGRLGYFFDHVAHLDDRHRNFVLGAHLGAAASRDRIRFVRRVRDAFNASLPLWILGDRPMYRPDFDAAMAIESVDVREDGTIGPDWWPGLLERLADESSWPSQSNDTMRALRARPADAAWFLGWVFEKPMQARDRFSWLRFLQRNFSRADRDAAPAMEIAVRALQDMPALALSLDRMQVHDPRVHEVLARAARMLTTADGPSEVVPALRAWQGAFAILEQLSRYGVLDEPALSKLLISLASAAPGRPSQPDGLVAAWFFNELLPTMKVTAGEGDAATEGTVVAALVTGRQPDVRFRWAGIEYRLDLTGSAVVSATEIRSVTPGPHLEHVALARHADQMIGEGITSLEQLSQLITLLDPLVTVLKDARDAQGNPSDLPGDFEDAIDQLRRIRVARDLPRAMRQRPAIRAALDYTTSVVLSGFAYALAVSPTRQPARIYADGPATHDFGLGFASDGQARPWRTIAWVPPTVTVSLRGGTRLTGSLLGLDLARSSERLLRVGMTDPPAGGVIPDPEMTVLVQRAGLRNRAAAGEADGRDVAAAVARGRARADAWQRSAPEAVQWADELRAAGLTEWRSNLIIWSATRQRDWAVPGKMLSSADWYRLGATGPLPPAWGSVGRAYEDCWCLKSSTLLLGTEHVVGRQSGLLGAAATQDLMIQMAVLLFEVGVPHALLEPMLPMALQDLVDHLAPFGFTDWEAFTWSKALTRDRIEDYLQGLVAQGLIVSASANPGGTP